jgi:ornithine cyclodeaminase
MKIITSHEIAHTSFETLFNDAIHYLLHDLNRWDTLRKSARHATYYPHGVFELMPCADDDYYGYKYVNAHPDNPKLGKLSIVGFGMLADTATGYPILACDMTLLTAIRTAAMSAIAARNLARADSKTLALIGTGAQSEFQARAMMSSFPITAIRYFDRDARAMEKFAHNMRSTGVSLHACASGASAVRGADIITTCICEKARVRLFSYEDIQKGSGTYINAIGGDCPGKTELDPDIMRHARIAVEFYEQTKVEGEIQNLEGDTACDEMWEIIQGRKPGRTESDDLIVFDSVGFALADFAVLRMMHESGIGTDISVLPEISDPKNLFSLFSKE